MRVLIVDDHEPVRRGIRSLLARRSDWSVCGEAADGLAATKMARELRPDVVLMDMSMPGMDGAEAARIIRQDVPQAEVIIVTQNDPAAVRQHAAQIGARGYVSKATLARDLLPAILNIIGGPMGEGSTPSVKEETPQEKWLFGGGDLGHLIREHDWSQTPLGPIENWPQSLKTSVNLMLNSQHPIWIGWGPKMTFLYNDAYISVLSLAKHPGSLGRPAREVWAEIWDLCGPLADKVFARGEPSFLNDMRLFMNRGEYLEETYFSFSYNPIYDESGRVAGLFCPSSETTAKNLHARRLRTLSELSAKALVEKSSEAACVSSIEIIAQNPDDIPFCLLYLLDQDRSVATLKAWCGVEKGIDSVSPLEIRLKESVPKARWPIKEVVWSGQSRLVQVADLDALPWGPAGRQVTETMVLPVTSPGEGQPIGLLIAGVNPTRKLDSEYRTFYVLIADQVGTAIQNARAVESERKRADALAEIDRAKTQFFSNVSHEFRTPLTLMLAPVEDMLANDGGLTKEQRDRLQLAHRNSLRLLKLVNTLLDFSRIEAGRVQAVYEPTDVSALTAELASMFQSATDRAGLKLIVDCPKITEPLYVDREMWEKIVFNLLSNAFKFTFAGEIEVSLKEKGRTVELSVRDTGTGIPEDELPHLFERFYRVKDARGRTFEGSGIGLALVQELARLHGGTVRVESEVNRGSTFCMSVPLGREHLPADRIGTERTLESTAIRGTTYVKEALRWLPGSETLTEEIPVPAAASTPEVWPKRARILLADDNADMRDYVQRLLRDRYEVIAAGDGQSALETALEQRPDLILSDVMMPRLDGFGLLKAVRADDKLRGIPVILLSARAGEESRIEGIESGADDYLIKPFSARELLARVQTQLELARVRKESEEASARRAEAVGEAEQRLRLATEAAELGIWNWYPEEDCATWENERMFEIYGRTHDDRPINLAEFLETVIHPEDAPAFRRSLQWTLENGERFFFQGRVYRKNGDMGWVEFTGQLESGKNGAPIRVVGTTRDITDWKTAEERERRISEEAIAANAKFRAVFEQTTVFAGIMTTDGVLIEANRLCLEACGYRAEDVLGRQFCETPWWRYFRESQEKIRAATAMAARGVPYRELLHYSWADGTERLVDFALYPIVDEKGQIIYLHPTAVDITDLKRAEEAYRTLAESLEAEVRARTMELEERNADVMTQSQQVRELSWRLLRTQDEERRHIARELHDSAGQMLTVLGMNLASLVQQAKARVPEMAETASETQELVQQLTKEIRTTSYLLHPPLLDENGLPAALSWYVRGLTERGGLDIVFKISEEFGRLPREMELVVFRLVQECLTNIHRHSGSKNATIQVIRDRERVIVEVQDSGKGIPREKIAEIQTKGSGVGIRGMRERLRQFGGEMRIDSGSTGTTVVVTIPLARTARPMAQRAG